MEKFRVGPIEIRGTLFPVWVDEYGKFWSEWDGEVIGNQETREELRALLDKATKEAAANIRVPFSMAVASGKPGALIFSIRQAEGVGVHAGNGNLLIRWEDGTRSQDSYSYGSLERIKLRRLSDEEEDCWLDLLLARARAERELKRFQDEHGLDVKEAVKKALAAALEEGQHGQD